MLAFLKFQGFEEKRGEAENMGSKAGIHCGTADVYFVCFVFGFNSLPGAP